MEEEDVVELQVVHRSAHPRVAFAKAQINGKYNLFDPQGTEKGEFVAAWKLRLNISKDELLNLTDKQY